MPKYTRKDPVEAGMHPCMVAYVNEKSIVFVKGEDAEIRLAWGGVIPDASGEDTFLIERLTNPVFSEFSKAGQFYGNITGDELPEEIDTDVCLLKPCMAAVRHKTTDRGTFLEIEGFYPATQKDVKNYASEFELIRGAAEKGAENAPF